MPLHRAVEDGFADLDLTKPADYAEFLRVHAMVIPPLEAALERIGIAGILPDWPRRRRASALAEDLRALGAQVPEAESVRIAPGAEALGVAYVLEGSRLGAAMLLKTLPESLPRAFLGHGRGEKLFQSFVPILDTLEGKEREAATRGASQAFEMFLSHQSA
ncbi:biliverdin-producing heme oxygenase [Roseococcus sp. YIM B11640]|uniref:biliverdin-producing heme oxygenase n=1 Tax=Roseococcus sp. YIM B11640 TaxID=3133973 RepID=UPI003C7EB20A